MKLRKIFLLMVLFISIISDEPTADHVRAAYNAFTGKFKTGGGKNGYALTNVDGFWQSAETSEVFIDAY